jgi:hypothetical protein
MHLKYDVDLLVNELLSLPCKGLRRGCMGFLKSVILIVLAKRDITVCFDDFPSSQAMDEIYTLLLVRPWPSDSIFLVSH